MKRPTSLPPLVGPWGKRVSRAELDPASRAPPAVFGVRNPVSGFQSNRLTPARCASILRSAAEGEWEAFLEVAEEMEERDAHYQAVLSVRKRQVAQLPITVEAASDEPQHEEHADFIRRWLKRGVLRLALFDILDAIGKGFSVSEIEWHTDPRSGIWPKRLKHVPQRWFRPDMLDRDTPKLRGVAGEDEDLAEHLYLLHRHPSKTGLTIRSGIAFMALWSWMLKRFSDGDWASFVERYGMPVRVGKYDPASSEEDRDVLWRAVQGIAGDTAAIIPQSMQIDFVTAMQGGSSQELHEKRARYLDEQLSKLVLGQTATTDAIAGGHAVGQEHRLVQGDIERSDALLISATITGSLVPWIVAFNFGPQDEYPTVSIGRPDEIPLKDWIDAVDRMAGKGLRVAQSAVRDRLGIEEPGEDEELLTAGAPAAAPMDPLAGLFARYPYRPRPQTHAEKRQELEELKAALLGRLPKASARQLPCNLEQIDALFDLAADRRRVALMSKADQDLEEALVARMAETAGPAIAAQLAAIRKEFDDAQSLEDLKDRLDRLKLDPGAFAAAMQEGVFLANLAGRAALLEEASDEE